MADLSIAPDARTDLRDLRRHSESAWGRLATQAYVDGVRTTFARVLQHPLIGRPEFDLAPDLRSIGYRSHRVYYLPVSTCVRIVRVLHHARDIELAFDP